MVFCGKCGAEVAEDVFFCSKCGARTARGADEGVEPHWRKDLDKALQTASKNLDAGLKEAKRSLEEVARDLGPELDQAREGLKGAAEDVGEELRDVADRLKGRVKKSGLHCPSCGAKNSENAKFCIECGKALE
ncbi:MAG: zinc-ribbon domain-containing protein [Candidatus Bathyarchaeia archaeon]